MFFHDFPMILPWVFHDFIMVFHDFPMVFPWFSYGFSLPLRVVPGPKRRRGPWCSSPRSSGRITSSPTWDDCGWRKMWIAVCSREAEDDMVESMGFFLGFHSDLMGISMGFHEI